MILLYIILTLSYLNTNALCQEQRIHYEAEKSYYSHSVLTLQSKVFFEYKNFFFTTEKAIWDQKTQRVVFPEKLIFITNQHACVAEQAQLDLEKEEILFNEVFFLRDSKSLFSTLAKQFDRPSFQIERDFQTTLQKRWQIIFQSITPKLHAILQKSLFTQTLSPASSLNYSKLTSQSLRLTAQGWEAKHVRATICRAENQCDVFHLKSKRHVFEKNQKQIFFYPQLFLFNVPVLVLPRLTLPSTNRNQWGLFPPKFHWSTQASRVSLPLFLPLLPSLYVTLSPEIFINKPGQQFHLKLEAKLTPQTDFNATLLWDQNLKPVAGSWHMSHLKDTRTVQYVNQFHDIHPENLSWHPLWQNYEMAFYHQQLQNNLFINLEVLSINKSPHHLNLNITQINPKDAKGILSFQAHLQENPALELTWSPSWILLRPLILTPSVGIYQSFGEIAQPLLGLHTKIFFNTNLNQNWQQTLWVNQKASFKGPRFQHTARAELNISKKTSFEPSDDEAFSRALSECLPTINSNDRELVFYLTASKEDHEKLQKVFWQEKQAIVQHEPMLQKEFNWSIGNDLKLNSQLGLRLTTPLWFKTEVIFEDRKWGGEAFFSLPFFDFGLYYLTITEKWIPFQEIKLTTFEWFDINWRFETGTTFKQVLRVNLKNIQQCLSGFFELAFDSREIIFKGKLIVLGN
jgi:hypothetical protein